MTMQARAEALVQEFKAFPDWEGRYKRIIEMGRELAPMASDLQVDQNLVKGCQSQVWLHASLDEQGRVNFQGDSDALIVKGLVAVLLKVYSGVTPGEILRFPPEFIRSLGFEGNLSPSRANGLNSMLKQIRNYAIAFDFVLKSK